jgi:anti-anti-sigma regulatory factor
MRMSLPPELTLANAASVKSAMLEALESGEPLELDASEVTDVDVAGLQLLCALHLEAAARKVDLAFGAAGCGPPITDAAKAAGLTSRTFWGLAEVPRG